MLRATGVGVEAVAEELGRSLSGAGQVPLDPPNVGGWPGGANWLTSSATLARYDLAGTLAVAAPAGSPLVLAAQRGDWTALADGLGSPEGFSSATLASLKELPSGQAPADRTRLALAIAAPDLVVG